MMRATILLYYLNKLKRIHQHSHSHHHHHQHHHQQHQHQKQPQLLPIFSLLILLGLSHAAKIALAGGQAEHRTAAAAATSQQYSNKPQLQTINQDTQKTGNEQEKQQQLHSNEHHNVHKLMSEQDLRRTFQVHTHDQVPEYEILTQLTVQGLKLPIDEEELKRLEEGRHSSSSSSALPRSSNSNLNGGGEEGESSKNDEIVMNLSTFGKDFKLRLKRNVEFQQRIKDMKMFMAESTKDGQLRYTEIKSHQHQQQNNENKAKDKSAATIEPDRTQPASLAVDTPHKRAASSEEFTSSSAENEKKIADTSATPNIEPNSALSSSSSSSSSTATQTTTPDGDEKKKKGEQQQQQQHSSGAVWNIGSTYHDEDNLAALLIDHDRKTGQLRVDGTIGNDFVIKPMPQATIDALLLKRQQQQLAAQAEAEAEAEAEASRSDSLANGNNNNNNNNSNNNNYNYNNNGNNQPSTAPNLSAAGKLDLARTSANNINKANDHLIKTSSSSSSSAAANKQQQLQADGMEHALHMHDDDPHDDDEMFLDEDEAIELAHLHSTVAALEAFNSNHTTSNKLTSINNNNNDTTQSHQSASELQIQLNAAASNGQGGAQQQQQHSASSSQLLPQPRALSKAASERKWKKYRKLMAQTQVPKPNSMATGGSTSGANNQQQQAPSSSDQQQQSNSPSNSAGSRARRHAHSHASGSATAPKVIQVSHHIVYRQKPSSESSSGEHQHSFMISPSSKGSNGAPPTRFSASSMEQLATSFSAQRLSKRSTGNNNNNENDNMIDITTTTLNNNHDERLADHNQRQYSQLSPEDDADFLHDPLGGQFYLEPGSVTGFERAGYTDWSLIGSGRRTGMAPPPYAINGTEDSDREEAYYRGNSFNQTLSAPHSNNTSSSRYGGTNNNHHQRVKRQSSGRGHSHQMRMGGGGSSAASQVRRKRQAPDTVWPEVLLVVDYDSFLLHGGDSRDVKRYFVSFWNGVDLRYKLLVHPHIRISLAGMIVAKDRDATPYLERNRLRAPNADAVDAAGALTDMGKYLYREDRLPTYDLAVVITKLDMCRRRNENGRCNRGTAGFAYVGGACVVNKRLEKVNSVAIIEDSGGFSGIIVAAHEVGHLLGCVHDGSPPPLYLGGPGATHCPWEDGFIMSDLRHTERGFRWSQCSVEQFKHFLNGETATCLYNYPHESQMLHRLLPGTMLSLDEQCKRDRGTNACFKDARVCAQLFCFDSASGYCVSYRPAAEGSPCGEGQVCRNGKCVGEIENIIPDYTHQSQTVVAARGRPSSVVGSSSAHSSSGRLADNGLSASSTSTATSSPDNKLLPASVSGSAASGLPAVVSTNQLTSRMDTFPVDTPLSAPPAAGNPYSTHSVGGAAQFGGRYSSSSSPSAVSASTATNGLMIMRKQQQQQQLPQQLGSTPTANKAYHHYQHQLHPSGAMKSAKLVDYGGGGGPTSGNTNNKQHTYQQRSGHQATNKGANPNRAAPSKQFNNNNNINQIHPASGNYFNNNINNNNIHHHHGSRSSSLPSAHYGSTGGSTTMPAQLYSSASTMSHQYPISSSSISAIGNSNNLLTSSSSKLKTINL